MIKTIPKTLKSLEEVLKKNRDELFKLELLIDRDDIATIAAICRETYLNQEDGEHLKTNNIIQRFVHTCIQYCLTTYKGIDEPLRPEKALSRRSKEV